MVGLELLIDGSRATAGADQVKTALRGVQDQATQTEAGVRRIGASFSNAFQATGGTLQVAQGIGNVARSMQELNIAAAGFAGSRVLLEIGRVGQDLAQVGGRIGAFGAAFARLNPVLLIASTAMSAVSLAMSLFSNKTDEATDSVKRQATALDGLIAKQRELDIRAGYGAGDPRKSVGGTIDTLTALRTGSREKFTTKEAAGLFGVSEEEIRYALGVSGVGEAATELRQVPRYDRDLRVRGYTTTYAQNAFSNESVTSAGEYLLRNRQRESDTARDTSADETSFSRRHESFFENGGEGERLFAQIRQQELEEAKAAMAELQDAARQVGEALGDGVADLVQGLRSAKQVAASLLSDLTRAGLRSAVGGLAAGIAGSFGGTGAQQPKFNTPGVTPTP